MKLKTKILIGIEVLALVLIFSFILLNKPSLVNPPSGFVIRDLNFSFDFDNADKLIIATNSEFKDPIVLKETRSIELPPGTYYWKAKGLLFESETRNFTIVTHVALKLEGSEEGLVLSNIGNVDLNITNNETSFIMDVGDSELVENGTFEGGQR